MSQWVQNLIPFFVLVPFVLLFFGFHFSRLRRAHQQNADALAKYGASLEDNLRVENRQADALERIAAALEARAGANATNR
jgi:hypothetical protein